MLKENSFIKPKYIKLFIAAILGWLVCLLGGMADSVIAGLYLDSNAVAAVELVTPLYSFIYFLAVLISYGCAIMYSTSLGAFQVEKSQKVAGLGLLVSIVIGIVLFLIFLLGKAPILGFYGCEGELYNYASDYYNPFIGIALISPVLWLTYYLVSNDGDEIIVLGADLIMAISNTVVSFILVQSMGIAGLGIGTLVSNASGLIILIPHFFKKNNSIHFKWYFSLKDLVDMLKLSSAGSATNLYVALVDIIFNKFILETFGDAYLPAYAVVNVVLNFAAVLLCSIQSGNAFISIANGENNPCEVRRVMKLVVKFSIAISIAFTALLYFLAPVWAEIYAITDPLIVSASIYAGRVIPLTYIVACFVYILLSYYPAIERTIEGNIMGFSYMMLGPVILAIPLGKLFGFNAMSIGFALTPIFSILVILVYFVITKKLKDAPLLLDETDEVERHFDLRLNVESILQLRDEVGEFLKEQNVSDLCINEVKVIIEDSLVHIMNKNGKKKILCECLVFVNDKHVRLITKDNGVIFDITKEADDSLDLRCYVIARMMESAKEKNNTTTISFNRNTYIWERA